MMESADSVPAVPYPLVPMHRLFIVTLLGVTVSLTVAVRAIVDLEPHTLQAFERYTRLTEERVLEEVGDGSRFLHLQHLSEARSRELLGELRNGELYMTEMETSGPGGQEVEIDDGMIHHWLGAVFIPGGSLEETLALVQDYDRHDRVYEPDVQEARVLERDGNQFRVFMRFRKKKVITVVVDTIHAVRYVQPGPDRAYSLSHTTEVHEVEDAGEPDERQIPEGEGHGFLWRLDSYWRFLEVEGGVFVESESVSLTRTIPFLLRWLVAPFVNDVPRESLAFLLETTRRELAAPS